MRSTFTPKKNPHIQKSWKLPAGIWFRSRKHQHPSTSLLWDGRADARGQDGQQVQNFGIPRLGNVAAVIRQHGLLEGSSQGIQMGLGDYPHGIFWGLPGLPSGKRLHSELAITIFNG